MCCKDVNTASTFTSNQTNEIFGIYDSWNWKSKYVIYLLECSICKIQYVEKSKTLFHIRINKHKKDIKDPSAIQAYKYFIPPNHDFNTHGKFTTIEQLRNITSLSTKILKKDLNKEKTFGIEN